MRPLVRLFTSLPAFETLCAALERSRAPAALDGLQTPHKAHLAAALRARTGRPVLLICHNEQEQETLAGDTATFAGEACVTLADRELVLQPMQAASREWEHGRIAVLRSLLRGEAPLLCAVPDALSRRTMPPAVLSAACAVIAPGEGLPLAGLLALLARGGYKRAEYAEAVGQYSARGGIVDFYSPGAPAPVRVEYYGDDTDTVSYIDITSQRRGEPLSAAALLPCAETLPYYAPGGPDTLNAEEALAPDRYIEKIYPQMCSALDYLPADTIIVPCEYARVDERMRHFDLRALREMELLAQRGVTPPDISAFGLGREGFFATLARFDIVYADTFARAAYAPEAKTRLHLAAKLLPPFGPRAASAVEDARHYLGQGARVALIVPQERRAEGLELMLREAALPVCRVDSASEELPGGFAAIMQGGLSAGAEYPGIRLAVLAEGSAGAARSRVARAAPSARQRLAQYGDLAPGDIVVHEHHGIARFEGVVTMEPDGLPKDFVKLRYSGSDCLYVPVTQLHCVSKYIGQKEGDAEGARGPKLSKLGGADWQRSKSRAKAATRELARGLIELYAARKRLKAFAFCPDSDWQLSFEERFEYAETEDQLRCCEEIKRDMQSDCSMDRLLCGDVGFGKTEVALRAVMKSALSGKQAALLVPTTVLAQQHYITALRRFAGYPVNIDTLSRFSSPAQIKASLKNLREGKTDLIIGTHRLLQKDVVFRSLGLLIVDEEQRFGVAHKERLKELSRQVDVLTLTATPIPRTLNMALSGLRDMSVLEEAPSDRHPVQTYVLEYDEGVVCDAIEREAGRGGQTYYLHNRVDTIDAVTSRLAERLPGIAVAAAHGQMREDELRDVMQALSDGLVQVLVCTTIIETGIDIPNVNTLIVEDADRLGLAQLHQIRGRVGRSSRRAYAYLTYRRGKLITETAERRLAAIREYAEFGSGFKLAMRDLEIRGAGNVLGAEQSGHLMSVGYDMYLRLLEEAVLEERGERAPGVECTADLPVEAVLGKSYISHAGTRMDYYRLIAAVTTEEQASDLRDELSDRFGDVPESADNLIKIALLRASAARAGICDISCKEGALLLRLASPDIRRVSEMCARKEYKGRAHLESGGAGTLSVRLPPGQKLMAAAKAIIADFAACKETAAEADDTANA
ncbi:MAG: transcription-repair coupling factor [Oscillospiraceae bacterium]|jgi:transcription-repair coupling factor (superfamily II helicase)|nr:transcription-repair coupling factor [Oscillospiraceae bacterium]